LYNLDFVRLVKERIPGDLRTPFRVLWLYVLIAPVRELYSLFLQFKIVAEREVQITSNQRVLQHWANQYFDPVDQRIIIKDYEVNDLDYLFPTAEDMPIYLPDFLSAANFDFEVCVPLEYQTRETQIRAYIDKYKLVSKQYKLTFKIL